MAAEDDSESMNFQLFLRDFQHVIDYLGTQRKLMDAHMVDYFTSNHWETLLPLHIRKDLESLSPLELASLPTACNDESETFDNVGHHLKNFLNEAKMAQLKSFSWLKDAKEFSSELKVDFISHIMSPKKSYEVEVMSDVVHRMATQFNVRKILDLGSGKGYLSQNLALQYGLKVVGVDSSLSNTQNAVKRNEKLLKAWNGLVKKSCGEKLKMSNSQSDKEIMLGNSNLDSCSKCPCSLSGSIGNNDKNSGGLEQNSDIDNKQDLYFNKLKNNFIDNGQIVPLCSKYETDHKDSTISVDSSILLSSECCDMDTTYDPLVFSKCEQHHHKNALVRNISRDENYCEKKQSSDLPANGGITSCEQSQSANSNSFLPVTGFVDQSFVASGELKRLFDELFYSPENSSAVSNGLFLVGLHTCGDLVPMALRIFVNEPSVKLICVVGCCYHLVSQQFGSDVNCVSDDPGFPMSQFLKPFKLHVSRNATMVAQQAADRISSESKVPPPSVLFRAILQVILKEKFGLDGRGLHVGKAGSKCKTFKEYVHKCLNKLGLQDRIWELSDEEVELYHERFKSHENQLHAFHQLRAAIAPCIESVFLLDRLCYLHEKGFKSASIVRLFDPVKSPRCYAIIATKE